MKNPFNERLRSFDAATIDDTIRRALASAGLATPPAAMHGVTDTVRRAWAAASPAPAASRSGGASVDEAPQRGRFEAHEFSHRGSARAYKLYVPAGPAEAPRAMLVMLHGCTQSADDFAAGTQMNRLADRHGFLVVYPEQAAHANTSKCWNWFKPQDQQRDAGEPALIAGIVRQVAEAHRADPRRVFVAGLSAGAAMAVTLGQTYPELFAAVGAHSGLPYASAHDIPSALAAMKGGRSGMAGLKDRPAAAGSRYRSEPQAVPVIVFHGDRDHTVQQSNGAQIVQQAQQAHLLKSKGVALLASAHDGVATGGRRYTRIVHADAAGHARIESWTLHGAGHAWSGGHAGGSYTDSTGPDASAEMIRFFLALPREGAA